MLSRLQGVSISTGQIDTLSPPPAHLLDGASLFLDLDGTLVELIDRPDDVVADEALRELLAALGRTELPPPLVPERALLL